MGQPIADREFTAADFKRFDARLREQLERLRAVLSRPGFGVGEQTLGAEVELYLIDADNQPLSRNQEVLSALPDAGLALEINRYNLELNLEPVAVADQPLSNLERQILLKTRGIAGVLDPGQQPLAIGILPTLQRHHFGPDYMTEEDRYRALSRMLTQMRGGSFEINLKGEDHLKLSSDDVTLEGANTSMQIHIRVAPEVFNDWFNAVQLVTPIALGLAGNSPLLFGHRLWHETRIALFRQSIDGRTHKECQRHLPSRVDFGAGWVQGGAYELFAELVNLHKPILPLVTPAADDGAIPRLDELRLHSGTVWPWNRAVYDPAAGGHLRIEIRSLPAGPTPRDMVANAAFIIGAAAYFQSRMADWVHRLPFETLASNFYEAAQRGLDAEIFWPDQTGGSGLSAYKLVDLARSFLVYAEQGLASLGVESTERDCYLSVIENRLARAQTGSVWMLNRLGYIQKRLERGTADARRLVSDYKVLSNANLPVADWPVKG